jgi:hypothetical protein
MHSTRLTTWFAPGGEALAYLFLNTTVMSVTVGSQKGGRRCIGAAHKSNLARVVWVVLLLQGCTRSPSTNVLGAYFPDWLFCIVAAVAGAVLIRLLLLRASLDEWLDPPAVAYPALVALLAFAGWLLFF